MNAKTTATANSITMETTTPQIYGLIAQAMKRVGAVGKDSVNQTQGFKYRGIDAVMNALSPVMADLGLFVVPEVIDHKREERFSTKQVWDAEQKKKVEKKSTLLYSILTIKYTMFAPDGSNVSCVVIGEGMDSGDKASNKAMAVGLKYACFQMFMIPTEEMAQSDPDRESHDVDPKDEEPPQNPPQNVTQDAPADVTTADKLPAADDVPPVLKYLANERETLRKVREIGKAENNIIWKAQVKALTDAGMIPNKPLADFTQDEAAHMVAAMYANFDPTGTVLKNVGETA